jgi:hypothetical protein
MSQDQSIIKSWNRFTNKILNRVYHACRRVRPLLPQSRSIPGPLGQSQLAHMSATRTTFVTCILHSNPTHELGWPLRHNSNTKFRMYNSACNNTPKAQST